MPKPLTDEQFVEYWKRCAGSPIAVAKAAGLDVNGIYKRRANLAKKGIFLPSTPTTVGNHTKYGWQIEERAYKPRAITTIKDGWLIVFNDAHYWPGEPSTAHLALLKILKLLKPKCVIANGDIFDGATISRHDVLGWCRPPTVIEELDAVKTRMDEIVRAAPNAERFWTIGNHDSRYDRRLATDQPEFAGVPGMKLEDHLKDWPASYSVLINEKIDPVFVVHNITGGTHAPFNNAKKAGCTTITGHLHSQKEQPVTTLLRTLEGIDPGCLAEVGAPSFSYLMDRPADWRSGFMAMRFDGDGIHMPCEFVRVLYDGKLARAVFRSEVVIEKELSQ